MPFKIIRNDIVRMQTDAIVNTANPMPIYSDGTDRAVYEAAGAEQLLAERRRIGPMEPGQAAITPGFNLKVRYIIHTVGPVWRGGDRGEAQTLATCYRTALRLAKQHNCGSIAFPLISTGNYGFPAALALQIALDCFREFLKDSEMEIILVVFGRSVLQLSEQLVQGIDSYIDDHYVAEQTRKEYRFFNHDGRPSGRPTREDSHRQKPHPKRAELTEDAAEPVVCNVEEAAEEASDIFTGFSDFSGFSDYGASGSACAGRSERDTPEPEERLFASLPNASAPAPAAGYGGSEKASARTGRPRARRSLEDLLKQTQDTFQQQLFRLIAEKGMSNAEVYKRANLQKQLFSKIKSNVNYVPKKQTALALCIALQLNLDETRDLIGRAGYVLTPSSRSDLIVQYFIENEVYDIMRIDVALFDHALPTLSTY